ncbi:MAG: sugar phosphate isomerase/epimerase [Bryobacterales bacterium]|jgi:D-psicose/D-tagatose/L-ribulose 3-epimerase|nr:sugar phosphate isomerase/epimerase [Bryobacterales bacterium]
MRFGINTLLWTAAFGEEHLPLLPKFKKWGFDGVEIARFSFDGFPAAKIRAALESEGLECTFCSALTGETSLISAHPSERAAAREFLATGIQTAAELGAKVFLGPFCGPVGKLTGQRPTEDEWKYAVEGFQSLGAVLDACDVVLAHEPLNRFETYFTNLSADVFRLCEEAGHSRLGILFDTFHANIEEKDSAAAIRAIAPRLHHVHTCESDRGIPGTGQVHWDTVLPALKEVGYDGWLVIESFGSRIPEIAAAACLWRDVAPSADAIAADGLRFLKSRLG